MPDLAPTAPLVWIQKLCTNPNKIEFKNLDDSEVFSSDFPTTYAASLTFRPLQPHWPLQPLQPYFTKKTLPDPDGWIIPGTKMTNTGPFCGVDDQKSNLLLISDTLSVGGC